MLARDRRQAGQTRERSGIAAVELAFILPILIFICMATVDFARVCYAQVTLQNCARNGALYEFYKGAGYSMPSGWTSLSAAVTADEGSLTVTVPTPYNSEANPYTPMSATYNYITVTVQASFTLISYPSFNNMPSIPGSMTLIQSATMPYPASMAAMP